MKTTTMIMVIAMGMAMQVVVSGAENSPSATTKAQKTTLQQRVNKLLQPESVDKYKIERVGGISSRPWAQTVGWSKATPFVDGGNNEAHFNLFWMGSKPD